MTATADGAMGKAYPRRDIFMASLDRSSALKPVLLSLSLVFFQFLQSQPKQSVLVLQRTCNWQTTRTLSAMANMARTKMPGLSSDPTAHHSTSLAELVGMQARWSLAYDFQ